MFCVYYRRLITALPDTGGGIRGAMLRTHLCGCADCREYARRVRRVEHKLSAAFTDRMSDARAQELENGVLVRIRATRGGYAVGDARRRRRMYAAAGALAAAILLVFGIFGVMHLGRIANRAAPSLADIGAFGLPIERVWDIELITAETDNLIADARGAYTFLKNCATVNLAKTPQDERE